MSNKYLVINLTDKQKSVVQLRSSLENKSIDDYILNALNRSELRHSGLGFCPECQKKINIELTTLEHMVNVVGKESKINILNFPKYVCSDCNQDFINNKVVYYLEKVLDFEVLDSLKETGSIPEIMNFNDLIKL